MLLMGCSGFRARNLLESATGQLCMGVSSFAIRLLWMSLLLRQLQARNLYRYSNDCSACKQMTHLNYNSFVGMQ